MKYTDLEQLEGPSLAAVIIYVMAHSFVKKIRLRMTGLTVNSKSLKGKSCGLMDISHIELAFS
jgi:hypothetical protein